MPGDVIQLLREDPDLGENMPERARRQATELIRARVFRFPKGTWDPPEIDHGMVGPIRSLTEQGRIARDDGRRYVLLGEPPDWFRQRAPVGRIRDLIGRHSPDGLSAPVLDR